MTAGRGVRKSSHRGMRVEMNWLLGTAGPDTSKKAGAGARPRRQAEVWFLFQYRQPATATFTETSRARPLLSQEQ
jgi:hypothetical protein